ncbi:MAG: type II secretion system protein GspK, partial [Candidatus Aureabacteria bacterium]|nr:type II secretion system protein GspK [Candidatus Auribacterota bacterium]
EGSAESRTPPPKPVATRRPGQANAPRDIPYPDHYGEDWAKERVMEPFGPGYLTLKVIDESGKININTLMKEIKPVTAAPSPTAVPAASQGGQPPGTAAEEPSPTPVPRKWGQRDIKRSGEENPGEKAPEKPAAGEEETPPEQEPVRYVVDKKVEKDIMRLIKTLDVRSVDPEKVTAAIVDWMDSNDEGDWEDDEYGDTPDGSLPKNAPLEVISELLMVHGVTGDLFFGTGQPESAFLDEQKPGTKKRQRGGVGLRDCLTVYSKAKVNVNTAPPEVLTSLLEEENESLVKEIVSYTQKDYFEDLTQFDEKIGEHTPASFRARIGVGSDCVQIIAEGQVNDARKQIRAYVARDDKAVMRVLYWRIER